MIIDVEEFLTLRQHLPVADVRSQGEYAEGHIRGAVNIPILTNDERVAVGTDYKKHGQLAAIKTGFKLVGPRILDIVNEAERVASGNELIVHCWRGGMRSANFCQFAGMARIKTRQIEGGYKAYRQLALASFRQPLKLILIGGSTGSGKSEVLRALAAAGEQVIDLEKLASHKGSVFGGLNMPPQPTTEQFQNDLFEEILKLDTTRRIWVEDESIAVGKIFIPHDFWTQMCAGPIIEIVVDKSTRITRLVEEYGAADRDQFVEAMTKITKKLGGQHFNEARDKWLQGDAAASINILLNYYDKAYFNGLDKKKQRIKERVAWTGKDIGQFAQQLIQFIS